MAAAEAASRAGQTGGPKQGFVRGVPGVLVEQRRWRILQETLVTPATNPRGLVIEQHASWAERLVSSSRANQPSDHGFDQS